MGDKMGGITCNIRNFSSTATPATAGKTTTAGMPKTQGTLTKNNSKDSKANDSRDARNVGNFCH
jgi:hypothetical protein